MRHQWLNDITERISEAPKWWLEGVPRYCDYHPTRFRSPPTQALVRVNCLGCYQAFEVAYGFGEASKRNIPNSDVLGEIIRYVDNPPQHVRASDGFSCAGNSSGVEIETVLKVWQFEDRAWVRQRELEGDIL